MAPSTGTPKKPSIFPLLLVGFIASLGFSIVLPSLVYLVKQFKGNEFLYGALAASYAAFQMIGAPYLGKLSDRIGRRKVLFICSLGSAAAWAVFLVALRLPVTTIAGFTTGLTSKVTLTLPMLLLFIARSVDGLTAGDVSVANAYLADISAPEDRKAGFGKMGVAGNLGFMLGPAIAGLLGATSFGLGLPIAGALATSLIVLVLIVWFLPESRAAIAKVDAGTKGVRKWPGSQPKNVLVPDNPDHLTLRGALRLPRIPVILLIYFVFFIAFSIFVAAFPLYAVESLHWGVAQTGFLFSFLSIVIATTEGPVLSWLSPRVSAEALTKWGTLIVALGYLAFLRVDPRFAYLGAGLYALGNGLMWPSFLSLLSEHAGEDAQGYLQGIGSSVGSLASIVGLLLGGILYSHFESVVFLISMILVLIVFAMTFQLGVRPKTEVGVVSTDPGS